MGVRRAEVPPDRPQVTTARRYAAPMRLARIVALGSVLAIAGSASAVAYLQRTVNGPATVIPARVYTFRVSGFRPGDRVYPTVAGRALQSVR